MALSTSFFVSLFLILSLFASALSGDERENLCVYTIYVRTGSIKRAGTHSVISLTLRDSTGESFSIPNLEDWGGIMGVGHNYFEVGNLDIFSGRGPCLSRPICAMNITSDGSGPYAGWFCNYVEVTTAGPHVACDRKLFNVEQWLATDMEPFSLTTARDNCPVEIGSSDMKSVA